MSYTPALSRLIELLAKLPGIGEKTAARLAFFILRGDETYASELARAVAEVKESTKFCETCYGFSEAVQCAICADVRRDPSVICIVEEPSDVIAVERTHDFKGVYHVLMGRLAPLDGIGPGDLTLDALLDRVRAGRDNGGAPAIHEVIIGDATSTMTPFIDANDNRIRRFDALGVCRRQRRNHRAPEGQERDDKARA